ncbi:MAG TPA: hypothetical protein VEL74_11685 [Thermoanaerobaculia bacterium]|nr:hypothetical protein [Thermoanaerobaculia bacterium]
MSEQHNDRERELKNPATVQQELLAAGNGGGQMEKSAVQAGNVQVCLGAENGSFKLHWAGPTFRSDDFVALFANDGSPDDQWLLNQWQWAVRGTSYVTGTSVNPSYQARYMTWMNNRWTSIARSPAFPDKVCG